MTDDNFYTDEQSFNNTILDGNPYDIYKDKSLLIEPALTIKAGKNNLRFTMRLGYAGIIKFTNILSSAAHFS